MVAIQTEDLKHKTKSQLTAELDEQKQELAKLRAQKSQGTNLRSNRISDVRKSIARILTFIHLTQRKELKEFYKNKKWVPKDLRAKKTRAIRQRLTLNQLNAQTVKAHKKAVAFPQRKYAIKA